MSKKATYPEIGAWARLEAVAKVARSDRDDRYSRRVVKRALLKEPAIGQFVGVTYLYEGRSVPGGYEDPGYLADRRGVLVYMVRLGLRSKPVHVLPADFRPASGDNRSLPFVASPEFLLDYAYRTVLEPLVGSALDQAQPAR